MKPDMIHGALVSWRLDLEFLNEWLVPLKFGGGV
jgi:hypothetical protein